MFCLAEHCKYSNLQDELERDCIVVGVQDRKLSEKLQLEEKLKLEEAVMKAHQSVSRAKHPQADGQDKMIMEGIKAKQSKHPQHRGTSRQIKPTKSDFVLHMVNHLSMALPKMWNATKLMPQDRALPKHMQKRGLQMGD